MKTKEIKGQLYEQLSTGVLKKLIKPPLEQPKNIATVVDDSVQKEDAETIADKFKAVNEETAKALKAAKKKNGQK